MITTRTHRGRWTRWVSARHPSFCGARAFLTGAAAFLLGVTPSLAQQDIGAATIVVNLVNGNLPAGNVTIVKGDGVFRDEGVHTASDSSAKLVLRDNTNLSLGPNSSVKLDRFVYAGPEQAGTIAINIAKGAFRFATGNADKQAYTLNTPTASLGVRGTAFHGFVTPSQTFITSEEGIVTVCTRDPREKKCQTLSHANDRAVITARSATMDHSPSDPTNAPFDALCQAGMCTTTSFSRSAMVSPQDLLATHPAAGLALSTQVRDMALSDPSLVGALMNDANDGNDAQQAAIGAGLAEAAQILVSTNPQLAATIQQQVALSGLSPLITAFTAPSNGTETAAIGGGDTGGGVGGPVGGAGGNGGGGGGGGNPGANSFTAANSGSTNPAGFGSSGATGGGTSGATGGGTTLPCTNVSLTSICPPP